MVVGRELHSKSANNYSYGMRSDKLPLILALMIVIPNNSHSSGKLKILIIYLEWWFLDKITHAQKYLFPLACIVSKA